MKYSAAASLLLAAASSLPGLASARIHGLNHWVHRVSVRGGQSESTGSAVEDPALFGDEELAAKTFKDIMGSSLLKVADASKGVTEEVETGAALEGKHVALYFTSQAVEEQLAGANQEEGRPGFVASSIVMKSVYERAQKAGQPLEVVYVPVQDAAEKTQEAFKDMPWLSVKPDNATAINLIRKAGVSVLPSVVILDPQGKIITTDGYTNMAYFPEDFPWHNKGLRDLLGPEFERADGTKVGPEALQGKVLGLYFSADWCAPCKQFTPLLKETYEAVKAAGKELEIVYIGSDKEESEQKSYFGTMPWLAIPYGSKHRAIVPRLLGVQGLPTLLIFDENDKLITANGRMDVTKDVQTGTPGANFPWHPKPFADLSDSPEALARGPVVMLFMDGASKEDQAKLSAIAKPLAEERAAAFSAALEQGGAAVLEAPRKATFLAATEIDQLSATIRKLSGLEEIQGKWKFMKSKKDAMRPRFGLVSIIEGKRAISEETLTEEALKAFLAEFDAGALELEPFTIQEGGAEGGEGGDDADASAFQ
ncbi:thioredoxin [Tribonema minus]|uniref:Thioredoxin n=1 Tax=Tribonema minus TaxID=303371 RepID=A0A835Z2Y2_9STRA|nr:thioredoxin [Tribonema minus]